MTDCTSHSTAYVTNIAPSEKSAPEKKKEKEKKRQRIYLASSQPAALRGGYLPRYFVKREGGALSLGRYLLTYRYATLF